ncbi:helix-turn-helix domain-containing protein [Pelagibacterium flavum]|uniref:Helix-turn-helix domain-containing protein n=1 Tax=Pelagibacterium flavum TaxID=2984530 RepID=A0ABY6IN65_9HYPH|nr:helix-turn-helix domain-containing protein [Pelagibacterium sp. YIM 151497]UYQ70762.1 helix-turn-helix domain-containing protein [Pelagibacterium sp. YIM 151497]|eukprot:jgi/Tetstr1/450589/TSEL_037625.t1
MKNFPIGEAARRSGVKVPTIRYYEQIGLLPQPVRTRGNRRLYDEESVRRLFFILHARQLGFEIESIRAMLGLQDNPDQSCAQVDAIASGRLAEIELRISRLTALKAELSTMLDQCRQGRIAQCHVIETLSTPPG